MTPRAKHTPTPWRLSQSDCGETAINNGVRCVCWADNADAAFIVRAVNSHADLVAALEAARRFCAADDVYTVAEILAKIDAALARAKGEGK